VLQEVIRKADGVPLFVEELTKTVLESGLLREQADYYELLQAVAPLDAATLQGALAQLVEYVDVLKYHWIEQNQHTKIGPLEIAQLARTMNPDELSTAFDDVQGIGGLADEVFVGQVDQELATFQTVTDRMLTELEAIALHDALYQSMRTIWAEVSLTHPSFNG
jgi:hypothetical protein